MQKVLNAERKYNFHLGFIIFYSIQCFDFEIKSFIRVDMFIREDNSSKLLHLLHLTKKTLKLVNSETGKLRDFSFFFFSSTFIYEPILIKKKSMNANIMKTHIFIKLSVTSKVIKDHLRSS